MKNNTAECVLLSPDEYIRLMDELNDAAALRRLPPSAWLILILKIQFPKPK